MALPTVYRHSGESRNPIFCQHHCSQKRLTSALPRLESSVRVSTSRCFLADIHCHLEMYIPRVYTLFMSHSTVFKSNKTQAVRLPKAVALPDHVKKVEIIAQGNTRVIVPAGGTWADFFAGPRLDDDFLNERHQPLPQRRDDP